MKKYFPVLLSKKGEIVALQHLTQKVKEDVCPVIEVIRESLEKKVKDKEGKVSKIVYKDEFENSMKTHWNFFNNQIILDFSLVNGVEDKIKEIEMMLLNMINQGVGIIPAVQINSPIAYVELIKKLSKNNRLSLCFRTSEHSGGFENFKANVESMMKLYELKPEKIYLLLDLGVASKDNINYWSDRVKTTIRSLGYKINDWGSIIVASSSFPSDLTKIQKRHEVETIPRYEWQIWNAIISDPNFKGLKYGDFGTKYPFYEEIGFAGTVSIKYTAEDVYVIYKGEMSKEHEHGRNQYVLHASQLIKSKYYSGKDFSWGDMKINEIANQDVKDDEKKIKPGSPTTWVQISQNHHITLLSTLL